MQKFLIEMFDNARPDGSSMNGLSYFMTATDTANVNRMFFEVREAIIGEYLKPYYLL